MLGNGRLADSNRCLDMADTGFVTADNQQDKDAVRLSKQSENFRECGRGIRGYIRRHEYIITGERNVSIDDRHLYRI